MWKCCYMHILRSLISPGGPLGGGPPWLGPPWLGPHCCCGEWAGPENRPSPGGPGGPRSARGSLGPPPPNRWSGGGPLGSLGWSLGSPNGPRLSSVGNKTKWLFHKKCHVPHPWHNLYMHHVKSRKRNAHKISILWRKQSTCSVWICHLELTYLDKKCYSLCIFRMFLVIRE